MTCVNSCHSVLPQLNSSGLRADGESITTSLPKHTPKRAKPRHREGADGKVVMIGIHFKANRTFGREIVFRG